MSQRVTNGAMPEGRSSATGGAGKLRPDGGLLARIALSAALVGAGLAIVFAVLFLAVVSLRHRSVEARNSQEVIATANRVQTLVIDLETGVRGFVITHDERYLAPWREAQKQYPPTIATLLRLTTDNTLQHERAVSIRDAVDTYLKTFSRPVVGFMQRNPSTAPTIVTSRQGRQQVETIRRGFEQFLNTERLLSEANQSAAQR